MKDQFYLHFETMPKGTSQEKRLNRKTGVFFKSSNVASAEKEFMYALLPHKPELPAVRPIRLTVWFAFDTKDKKKWCQDMPKDEAEEWAGFMFKPTRPDTDNYLKLFKDCMTKVGFWLDDAQVVDERVIKTYAEKATIMVRWEEIYERD